nr:uncharacterized protein LOC104113973 isoform X2 [Nicotiana tomentosiformis]
MSACLPKDPIPEIPFAPQLVQKPNTCEFIWTTVRVYEVLIICSPPLRCGLHFSVLPSFSDLLDFLSCFSCQKEHCSLCDKKRFGRNTCFPRRKWCTRER